MNSILTILPKTEILLRPIHYHLLPLNKCDSRCCSWRYQLDNLINGGAGKTWFKTDEDWIDAIAEPDELLINVGDMLSRYTNNKLKSTIHQVEPSKRIGELRYSVPFYAPCDMPLNSLENCDTKNPKQFEDITAGDYLYERLVDLGLIKK
jgi:hypothetical protein